MPLFRSLDVTENQALLSPGERDPRSGVTRYKNLHAVSKALSSYGAALQTLALIVAVVAVISGLVAGSNSGAWGIVVVMVGALCTILIHSVGTFIAASGEGLLALADIATNTTPRSDPGSAS